MRGVSGDGFKRGNYRLAVVGDSAVTAYMYTSDRLCLRRVFAYLINTDTNFIIAPK
jgi:hypothetical protein